MLQQNWGLLTYFQCICCPYTEFVAFYMLPCSHSVNIVKTHIILSTERHYSEIEMLPLQVWPRISKLWIDICGLHVNSSNNTSHSKPVFCPSFSILNFQKLNNRAPASKLPSYVWSMH
jgi:hypothetical protein